MPSKAARKSGKDSATVVLVDDHPLLREGLTQLIEKNTEFSVCGQFEDAPQALRGITALHPDVAIIDLSLKEGDGLELVKDLKTRHPRLPVLVLSMHDESLYAERALRAGARGYIMKQEAPANILRALRRVLRGEIYVSDSAAKRLVGVVAASGGDATVSPLERLSDRELAVFQLIGAGFPTRDVADKLKLSVKTIESHRAHIKAKLKLKSAMELVRYAIHWAQKQ